MVAHHSVNMACIQVFHHVYVWFITTVWFSRCVIVLKSREEMRSYDWRSRHWRLLGLISSVFQRSTWLVQLKYFKYSSNVETSHSMLAYTANDRLISLPCHCHFDIAFSSVLMSGQQSQRRIHLEKPWQAYRLCEICIKIYMTYLLQLTSKHLSLKDTVQYFFSSYAVV